MHIAVTSLLVALIVCVLLLVAFWLFTVFTHRQPPDPRRTT